MNKDLNLKNNDINEKIVRSICDDFLEVKKAVNVVPKFQEYGFILSIKNVIITASIPKAKIGYVCEIIEPSKKDSLLAEVISIEKDYCLLTPIGQTQGFSLDAQIKIKGSQLYIDINPSIIGCVLNGMGKLILGNFKSDIKYPPRPVLNDPPGPFERSIIKNSITMGVKSIDAFLSVGEGQRVGVFAGAGVGKTSLLTMLVKKADFDIIVLGLIGERGREVREFIEHDLGEQALTKCVVIVSTSDKPPMERVKSAFVATTVAEYYRDQGKRVLLLLDSLTRFARALREVALAAGESVPPTGYPSSVFEQLPLLLERAGTNDKGSITAFYTVLVDGDNDVADPLASEIRSIVDGHIVLSRKLAGASHYPAIDVLASVSRVMTQVVPKEHLLYAEKVRRLMAKYEEIKLLVDIGEYQEGTDSLGDEAIRKIENINNFLRQSGDEFVSRDEMYKMLERLAK